MIKVAECSGFLSLQLMNIKYIPKDVIDMKGLKQLRLDCNRNINLRNGFPSEFSKLTMLSLKACRLRELPLSLALLTSLEKLYLEENMIEHLPDCITSLTNLTVLGMYTLSAIFQYCAALFNQNTYCTALNCSALYSCNVM